MIVPPPPPTYCLAPHLPRLDPGQQAALDACLGALTGRVASVVVVAATTTGAHHVLELATAAGTLLAIERRADEAPPAESWAFAGDQRAPA